MGELEGVAGVEREAGGVWQLRKHDEERREISRGCGSVGMCVLNEGADAGTARGCNSVVCVCILCLRGGM